MDYGRIYRDFIADRRRIEPTLEGYTEKHHILPRALGGGNEAENLIRLTPGDHFFAHLLLAKMHGGKMWSPVAFMVGGKRKNWSAVRSRRRYDWAMRGMAASRVRGGAYQFDHRIHVLEHVDGRRWRGLQADMPSVGMSRAAACRLVNGIDGSARGWFLEGRRPARMGRGSCKGEAHHKFNPEVFVFRHVDGRQFVGTAFALAEEYGLSPVKTALVRSGKQRVHSGWYRDGFPPLGMGRGAKLPGVYVGETIRLIHEDGREFSGTRREAVESLGMGSAGNLSMVLSGKRKSTGGWAVAP